MKNTYLALFLRRYKTNLFNYFAFTLLSVAPLNKALATTSSIESDSLKYSWERFSVFFGGFLTGLNNDIIIGNEQVGLGIGINLEDALDLKTSSLVLRGEAEYHFGKRRRSAVKFGYFGLYRDAKKVLETEIEFEDEIFPIGTELSSTFDLQIFKGSYDYAFYMDDRVRFGASIGLFVMPIKFSANALNKQEVVAQFTAPLPVLGLSTDFAITPKLRFRQSIEILYLKFSKFEGILADLNIRLEYNPWNHIGFGLGFNSYDLNFSISAESSVNLDFVGTIESSYAGLLFYGRYYF